MKNNLFVHLYYFIAILVFLPACSSPEDYKGDSNKYMTKASGADEEILVFMDTTIAQELVYQKIKEIFAQSIQGIAPPEPIFKLRFIAPSRNNSTLKQHKNQLYVFTTDFQTAEQERVSAFFTKEDLDKISKGEAGLFFQQRKDLHAKGQQILFLFDATAEGLIEKMHKNRQELLDVFYKPYVETVDNLLATQGQNDQLIASIKKTHGFSLRLPSGFTQVKSIVEGKKGFLYLKDPYKEFDKYLIVSYEPYTDEFVFTKYGQMDFRDSLCKEHLYANPNNDQSYLVTERKVFTDEVYFGPYPYLGNYGVYMKGLWRTNINSKGSIMGGPFLSYMFVDKKSNRIFYIEGFFYGPGKVKRRYMAELDILARSLEFVN